MADISFFRQLLQTQAAFVGEISPGFVLESGDAIFLPITFDEFTAPDLSITGINLTAGQTTISGTAGKFDNVRVGDVLSAVSTGTITAKTAISLDNIFTVNGLPYVVYPSTYTSLNLGVQAGDAIAGTGIPSSTVVDRIDYATRRIFISNNCTASAVQSDVTVTPPVRVTGVRRSTATSNPNQIDIDSTVGTNGSNSTLTVQVGARQAVCAVLRVTPIDSTSSGAATFDVAIALPDGTGVIGGGAGFNGLTLTSLAYTSLGRISFDGDTFLVNARKPRPASV